ncbi:hypothetical protein BH11MYX3_BH11MYX3_12040 [soil metagenome]
MTSSNASSAPARRATTTGERRKHRAHQARVAGFARISLPVAGVCCAPQRYVLHLGVIGLTSIEATRRLAEVGPNRFETGERWKRLRAVAHMVAVPMALMRGGGTRHFGRSASHAHTDRGSTKCWRIIDAVAGHRDDLPRRDQPIPAASISRRRHRRGGDGGRPCSVLAVHEDDPGQSEEVARRAAQELVEQECAPKVGVDPPPFLGSFRPALRHRCRGYVSDVEDSKAIDIAAESSTTIAGSGMARAGACCTISAPRSKTRARP